MAISRKHLLDQATQLQEKFSCVRTQIEGLKKEEQTEQVKSPIIDAERLERLNALFLRQLKEIPEATDEALSKISENLKASAEFLQQIQAGIEIACTANALAIGLQKALNRMDLSTMNSRVPSSLQTRANAIATSPISTSATKNQLRNS